MIPLSAPVVEGNAWAYVKECLDTSWVSSAGAFVGRFEEGLASLTGAARAVACVNGTAALHLALEAVGVRPGDKVVVPALSFIATANAVRYCGAEPVFVDCEPERFNIDLGPLEAALRESGVRALVVTHLLGYPARMPRILELARARGVPVIEDAAESVGSRLDGTHTGSFGAAGCLSFNGNKIVTCGGGGAVVTSDPALGARCKHLSEQAKTDETEYLHDDVGYNYRLTNLSAALGLSQLETLPARLERRARAARWYADRLPGVPVAAVPAGVEWNRWLFSVQFDDRAARVRALEALKAARIQSRPLFHPLPSLPPYARAGAGSFPQSHKAHDTVLCVPSSANLAEHEVDSVCAVLRRFPVRRLLA